MDDNKKIYTVNIKYQIPVFAESAAHAEKLAKIHWNEGLDQELFEFGSFNANLQHITNVDDLPEGYKDNPIWSHLKTGSEHFADIEKEKKNSDK